MLGPLDSPHKWPAIQECGKRFHVMASIMQYRVTLCRVVMRVDYVIIAWARFQQSHCYVNPNCTWSASRLYNTRSGHDDVITWKHFPRYWPFGRGIHWSPVHSPHKGQWRGALMFPLICARRNQCANNREAGDFRRHRALYDVIVMAVVEMPGDEISTYWCVKKMTLFCTRHF